MHANLVMPANQHFVEITIPNGVAYEIFQTAAHPGWDFRNETICKTFGQDWYEEKRSALLIVPSIPARLERNFLINPAHPDAREHRRTRCQSRCGGMNGLTGGSEERFLMGFAFLSMPRYTFQKHIPTECWHAGLPPGTLNLQQTLAHPLP